MIETEQEFMRIAVLQDPMFFGNAVPSDFKIAIETIEALRRFVRAHDAIDAARIGALTMDLKEYNALVVEFTTARRNLPDWISDDRR